MKCQAIDGLRWCHVGISHHVPGIIHEVQVAPAEYFTSTSGLFGFDKLILCSVENIDRAPNA